MMTVRDGRDDAATARPSRKGEKPRRTHQRATVRASSVTVLKLPFWDSKKKKRRRATVSDPASEDREARTASLRHACTLFWIGDADIFYPPRVRQQISDLRVFS
jgi:hypothetical protein